MSMKFRWQTASNYGGNDTVFYQVWRQTRELQPGEPMHSGVRLYAPGSYDTREEAQAEADRLNAEGR
jgi:hypothetical protein